MSEDGADVDVLLQDLSANIDGVDIALQPLLKQALTTTTSKLPLLDKAKLYVHTAYAIESLIFSYLKLNDVDIKSHPIANELNRVKAYFSKVKSTEDAGPQARLDKAAAGRFIKAGLAGNDEYDRKRADAKKQQEAGAKRKADALADRYGKDSRLGAASKRMKENEEGGVEELIKPVAVGGKNMSNAAAESIDGEQSVEDDSEVKGRSKKDKKKRKSETIDEEMAKDVEGAKARAEAGDKHKKRKKKSSHAPKDPHQAFQSLLSRSAQSNETDAKTNGKKPKHEKAK